MHEVTGSIPVVSTKFPQRPRSLGIIFILRSILKKLLIFLKGYKKESILAPAFKMLEAIFELLVPIAVTLIIDKGINEKSSSTVWLMCGFMVLLAIIGLISALCAQYFSAKAAVGFAQKLRSALFEKIQSFSYSVTDKIGTSTLITRMTSDVNSVQTGVNMFLRLFLRSPFIVFGAMVCAMLIDFKLGAIFAVTIIILSIIVFGIMIISIRLQKKTQARLDGVVSSVRGNFSGTRVIRAFNKQDSEISEFDKKVGALHKIQIFAGRISALMNPLTYAVINIAIIVLIQNGVINVNSGSLTQGELVALYNYMSQILVELIKLASLIITLNKASASAKRISDIMDMPSDIEHEIGTENSPSDYAVEFNNVSFRYGENARSDYALENLTFSVPRGATVGIIGGTGSGKSTIINLLCGFYHATEGNVFVNGKNASLLDEEDVKNTFGIVPQKATLFYGTVRSNLEWGKDSASDEEMWDALRLTCADEFVSKKELRLDEQVEQGGSNFSGGQKQRLTIARALIKEPKILVLDDSASALDYATEAKLRNNISSLDYSPTVFVVSQRASSIMHADIIIVLENGEAVGIGTHEQLLSSCEIYKEIYDSQFSKGGNAQ